MMVVVVVIVGLILWISRIGKYDDIHLEMISIFYINMYCILLMYLMVSDHCSQCCKAIRPFYDDSFYTCLLFLLSEFLEVSVGRYTVLVL